MILGTKNYVFVKQNIFINSAPQLGQIDGYFYPAGMQDILYCKLHKYHKILNKTFYPRRSQ